MIVRAHNQFLKLKAIYQVLHLSLSAYFISLLMIKFPTLQFFILMQSAKILFLEYVISKCLIPSHLKVKFSIFPIFPQNAIFMLFLNIIRALIYFLDAECSIYELIVTRK